MICRCDNALQLGHTVNLETAELIARMQRTTLCSGARYKMGQEAVDFVPTLFRLKCSGAFSLNGAIVSCKCIRFRNNKMENVVKGDG